MIVANAGTSTEAITITSQGAADVPLSIVGASAQTGNLFNITANGTTAGSVLNVSILSSTITQINSSTNRMIEIGGSSSPVSLSGFWTTNINTGALASTNASYPLTFGTATGLSRYNNTNGNIAVGNGTGGDASGSLNLANLTASGTVTASQSGFGSTPTDVLLLTNSTAAANGAQQYSGAINFGGQGWKTASTAASQPVNFRNYLVPVQGAANPTSQLNWDASINGGAATNVMSLTSAGALLVNSTIQTLSGYKSVDGTSGVTVTTCTGYKNGICISGT
jgi:hypothetical protein